MQEAVHFSLLCRSGAKWEICELLKLTYLQQRNLKGLVLMTVDPAHWWLLMGEGLLHLPIESLLWLRFRNPLCWMWLLANSQTPSSSFHLPPHDEGKPQLFLYLLRLLHCLPWAWANSSQGINFCCCSVYGPWRYNKMVQWWGRWWPLDLSNWTYHLWRSLQQPLLWTSPFGVQSLLG